MTIMVLLMLVNAAQATERILDLTRKVEDESRVNLDRSMTHDPDCPAQSTGRVEPAPTFSLVVERLNSAEYSMAGQIVADFRLTNTGNQTLDFPWVRRHEFWERAFFEGPDAIQVGLGLVAVDATGREHGLTGTILRGSRSQPGTLESIAPGESIRIRFPGWITFVDGPSAPVTGEARLFGRLLFRDGDCRTWQPVRSPPVRIWLRGRN